MDLIVGTLQFDFTIHAPREGSDVYRGRKPPGKGFSI